MVSNIPNVNILQKNPFNDFSKNGGSFYITQDTANDIYVKKQNVTDSENNVDNKRERRVGLIIGGTAVLATAVVFAITKGVPKNFQRFLTKTVDDLKKNLQIRKQNGQTGPITTVMNYVANKLTKLSERIKAFNNITNYKDLLFKEVMEKTTPTKKIHNKITEWFEKLSLRTVKKGYNKVNRKFERVFNSISDINQRILAKNPDEIITINGKAKKASEWLAEITKRQSNIQTELQAGFDISARDARYLQMKKANEGLDAKVWEKTLNGADKVKGFRNRLKALKGSQAHQSFIADELLQNDKMKISSEINKFRRIISTAIEDNFKNSKVVLGDIEKLIHPEDKKSRDILKQLNSALSEYKKCSGIWEQDYRQITNKKINEMITQLSKRVEESGQMFKYDKNTMLHLTELTELLKKHVGNSKKGEIEEILTIYKHLLPDNEYKQIKNAMRSSVSSLDKAINTESNLFFDKLRDMSLGSAPTDILSVLGSVGGVGLGLSMADNKEQRTSALLKFGIPVIGSIGTTVALTVGLVSGIKAMMIGLASGAVINRVGTAVDNKRKEKNAQSNQSV